jgi:hypothetical protein
MAVIKTYSQIQIGDYVRGHAHRINPSLAQTWRRVTAKDGDRIVTVDRHGTERVLTWDFVKHRGLRFKVWQAGDPREDGDNL